MDHEDRSARDLATEVETRLAIPAERPAGEPAYLRMQVSARYTDAHVRVVAAAASGLAALAIGLTLVGALPAAAGVAALMAVMLATATLVWSLVQSRRASRLEVMPGVIRYTGGSLTQRETIVHYDAVVAATVRQGLIERRLSRTATLELTLAAHGGMLRLRLPGVENAAAHRETVLALAATRSLDGARSEQLELARQTADALGQLLDEMSRLRQRMERL